MSAAALLCHPPAGSNGSGLRPAAAASEYAREVGSLAGRGLVLAPGWRWPAGGPAFAAAGPDGAPMEYEKGYGAVRADAYWFYSWASRAVTVNDPIARRRALEQLLRVRGTMLYRKRLPEDRASTLQMLERAQHGDLEPLRLWVRVNEPAEALREVRDGR